MDDAGDSLAHFESLDPVDCLDVATVAVSSSLSMRDSLVLMSLMLFPLLCEHSASDVIATLAGGNRQVHDGCCAGGSDSRSAVGSDKAIALERRLAGQLMAE